MMFSVRQVITFGEDSWPFDLASDVLVVYSALYCSAIQG